jgi:hypothetical protein
MSKAVIAFWQLVTRAGRATQSDLRDGVSSRIEVTVSGPKIREIHWGRSFCPQFDQQLRKTEAASPILRAISVRAPGPNHEEQKTEAASPFHPRVSWAHLG